MKNKTSFMVSIALLAVIVFTSYILGTRDVQRADASVAVSSEYNSTTTRNAFDGTVALASKAVIFTGPGTFGSFVITGANTGIVNFYDATTTDSTLRSCNVATTTVASFPASTVAGTYTFDAQVKCGLVYEVISGGSVATGTITFRK